MPKAKATTNPVVAFLVSPIVQLWVHLGAALVWAVLFFPGLITWRESVPFVVFVSIYANFVGHLSAAVSAIAARKADPDDPF